MACNVPESAIRIVRAEKSDIVTVTVQAPHGTKVRDYSAFQLLNGKPYIVDEMISIADWYHGHNVPVRSRSTLLTWWHRQGVWEQFILLWLAGFILVVLMAIAKHFSLYE